jgi:hypothetical protein
MPSVIGANISYQCALDLNFCVQNIVSSLFNNQFGVAAKLCTLSQRLAFRTSAEQPHIIIEDSAFSSVSSGH